MQNIPLKLQDLAPKESKFKLGDFPDKEFTLCRWSLRVKAWVLERYTSEEINQIFSTQKINDIALIAHYMLKEKDQFLDDKGAPTLEAFLDCIVTVQDQVNVIKALLATVGIGEPEIEKINAAILKEQDAPKDPNVKSPKSKTGAKSLTP